MPLLNEREHDMVVLLIVVFYSVIFQQLSKTEGELVHSLFNEMEQKRSWPCFSKGKSTCSLSATQLIERDITIRS